MNNASINESKQQTKKAQKHMSENTTMAPPLDLDLNSIDTTLPLLEGGGKVYELMIAAVVPKSSSDQKPMFNLQLNTTGPSKSQDGRDLGPGIPVFENLNLEPSGKASWDMVKRNVASVVQAAGINTTWGEFIANAPSLLQGQIVRCKVGVEPAGVNPKNGKSFKAKNVIEVWIPKGK